MPYSLPKSTTDQITPSPAPHQLPGWHRASRQEPKAALGSGWRREDATEWHRATKFAREKKTPKQCLKTESCYFNYGLPALSPIAFLTHSSANLVINQSRVARSCSLAPSLSLPCSLRAPTPLVCSPAPPVCAFLIGFGLELVSSECPQHGFHRASSACGEGRRWWRRWWTCLCLSGHVCTPGCTLQGYFCIHRELQGWGRVLLSHTWVQASAAGHVPTPSAPCFVPRNPNGKARVGAVGTLDEQGGDKILATQSFPSTDTGSAAQPTWQDIEAGENMEMFPCAFALEAAMESQLCCLSHTQKSQVFRPAGLVQHPLMLHWSCQCSPCTHQFLERILHVLTVHNSQEGPNPPVSCWSKVQQWTLRLRMVTLAEVSVHELFDTCSLLDLLLSTAAKPATALLLEHKSNNSKPFISLSPLPAPQIHFLLPFECFWVHSTVAEVLPSPLSPGQYLLLPISRVRAAQMCTQQSRCAGHIARLLG